MKRFYSFQSAILIIAGLLLVPLLVINPATAQSGNLNEASLTLTTKSAALQDFDAMVRQSRLEMPKFCGLVQDLMKTPSGDKEKQAAALQHIQTVKSRWEAVQQKYQDKPPVEYQRDKDFKGRLAEIKSGMENMEARLQEGKFKESFQTCANTCGLFVKMHEDNHLVYALDKLYHLRKMTKMITRQSENKQASAVKQQIGKMLDLRNQIFLAPCPAPEDETRCKNYQQSLQTLSAQLDKLALVAAQNNVAAVKQNLNELVQLIQKTYMLAL